MGHGQGEAGGEEARLALRVRELCHMLEKLRLTEYMRYLNDVRRLLWINFLTGLARGFGTAIGFTILGAIAITVLQRVTVDNLPIIGRFLADVVRMVEENLGRR